MTQRVPPNLPNHEASLLAAAMIDPSVYRLVEGIVHATDFYSPANQTIWRAFDSLAMAAQPIDQITVREQLIKHGTLHEAGGDEYLLGLFDKVPAITSAEHYAAQIAKLGSVRRLMSVLNTQLASAYQVDLNPDQFIEETEDAVIKAIAATSVGDGPQHISRALSEVAAQIQRAAAAGGATVGVPTGIHALDDATTGLQPGELYVVAARPAQGKSSLMTTIMMSSASRGIVPVFSLEMQAAMVAMRAVAAEANTNIKTMRAAKMSKDDWSDFNRAMIKLSDLPIYIDDTPAISLAQIRSRCRRLAARGKLSSIVIDYVQLMRAADHRMSREQQVGDMTRGLKELSKELGVPVVALAQLNRECEKRPDKRPQVSDLRESGSIEQDADAIFLLYRPGYYAAQASKDVQKDFKGRDIKPHDFGVDPSDGTTEIIIGKQRNGPECVIKAMFRAESASFVNIERRYDAPDDRRYGGD